MSYFEKIREPGETIEYDRKLHWVIYLPSKIYVLIALVFFYEAFGSGITDPVWVHIICMPAILFLIGGVLSFLSAFIKRATTEIIVTDRRAIIKRGLIARKTIEINMSKVESVDISQSILGRLFGYGTVLIRGTGSSYEPLRFVAAPLELRKQIATT